MPSQRILIQVFLLLLIVVIKHVYYRRFIRNIKTGSLLRCVYYVLLS